MARIAIVDNKHPGERPWYQGSGAATLWKDINRPLFDESHVEPDAVLLKDVTRPTFGAVGALGKKTAKPKKPKKPKKPRGKQDAQKLAATVQPQIDQMKKADQAAQVHQNSAAKFAQVEQEAARRQKALTQAASTASDEKKPELQAKAKQVEQIAQQAEAKKNDEQFQANVAAKKSRSVKDKLKGLLDKAKEKGADKETLVAALTTKFKGKKPSEGTRTAMRGAEIVGAKAGAGDGILGLLAVGGIAATGLAALAFFGGGES